MEMSLPDIGFSVETEESITRNANYSPDELVLYFWRACHLLRNVLLAKAAAVSGGELKASRLRSGIVWLMVRRY